MNRIIKSLPLCALLTSSIAWPLSQSPLKISVDVARYKYEETVGGQHFIDDHGTLFGLTGSMIIPSTNTNHHHRIFVRAVMGDLAYNGGMTITHPDGTTTQIPLREKGRKDYMFRIQDTIEYHIPHSIITPFFGLGFRLLHDDPPTYTSPGDYSRESHYLYLPVGLDIKPSVLGSMADVRLGAQYLLRGRQQSFMFGQTKTNDQHNGFGLSADATFHWKKDKTHTISVTPYLQYWHILASDIDSTHTILEPNNYTTQAGIRLGMRL